MKALICISLTLLAVLTQPSYAQAKALQIPDFLDIPLKPDGSALSMTKSDAVNYCAKQGARLPTARELGLLGMSFGAQGFVESCKGLGFGVYCSEVFGDDPFFYSDKGYNRPGMPIGFSVLWSSSLREEGSDETYVFVGDVPGIEAHRALPHQKFGVICVRLTKQ